MAEKMDSEREAFEAWLAEQGFTSKPEQRTSGKYVNGQIQGNWLAWQARAHLTQTAQAADVGALRELNEWLLRQEGMCVDPDHVAEALARALGNAQAEGWKVAADHIQKKADDYAQENCSVEHDTGAVIYHFGDAGRDYHYTLLELADEIRVLGDRA